RPTAPTPAPPPAPPRVRPRRRDARPRWCGPCVPRPFRSCPACPECPVSSLPPSSPRHLVSWFGLRLLRRIHLGHPAVTHLGQYRDGVAVVAVVSETDRAIADRQRVHFGLGDGVPDPFRIGAARLLHRLGDHLHGIVGEYRTRPHRRAVAALILLAEFAGLGIVRVVVVVRVEVQFAVRSRVGHEHGLVERAVRHAPYRVEVRFHRRDRLCDEHAVAVVPGDGAYARPRSLQLRKLHGDLVYTLGASTDCRSLYITALV